MFQTAILLDAFF